MPTGEVMSNGPSVSACFISETTKRNSIKFGIESSH
jgi:hypothetical protein